MWGGGQGVPPSLDRLDVPQMQAGGKEEPSTWDSLVDYAKNALSKDNLPLTSGILAALAQWWENKYGDKGPQYEMGEGLDYYGPERGAAFNKAYGGRIGFANGDEVRDPEYEGWKQIYEQNPEVAMMMHSNSAEYLKKYNEEMQPKEELNNNANGGIIEFARGGYVTPPGVEMDLRRGGFIPIGSQQKADDVAARVSKDEFVMTADAVKAAGGGSIARGSQRMYDLMNRLEGVA